MTTSPQTIDGAGGTTVSFSNTPQAKDDTYTFTEEAALDAVLYLNVMSNDSGGNAKTLWSIDDAESDPITGLKKYAPEDL